MNPQQSIADAVPQAPATAGPFSRSTPGNTFELTAAIVAYRNPIAQLRRALESLAAQPLRIQTVLVDNAGDEAVAELARDYNAIYLHSHGNIGFGRAHNLAWRRVGHLSPYHLVLNPDVFFDGPVLETLLDVMAAQPDVGVVMPKILYGNGATQHLCKRLPTPWDLVVRRFAPGFARGVFQRTMDRYELRDRDYDQPMEPPTLSGCFLLLRNTVVDHVGLFDSRFFLYMEDVDLVRRVHSMARALYYPSVAVMHEYQKGSYRNGRLAWHHVRSAVQYFMKWGWIFDQERRRLNQRSRNVPQSSITPRDQR